MSAARRRPAAGERGSITVEMVLLAPVFVAFCCLVVGLGRLDEAHGQLVGAASDAARAASDTRTAVQARTAAADTAQADLTGAGLTCRHLSVTVETGLFTPGGSITVTLSCTAGLGDVMISGLPGAKTITASASAPVDRYRGLAP